MAVAMRFPIHPRTKMRALLTTAGILLAGGGAALGQVSTNSFQNWETPPVHPVALSPDGSRLVVCNLPDNRLEIFALTDGVPVPMGGVCVGLDPCTARFRTPDEVWVANFISDTISIVSVSGMRVVATINTANEPSDIVFAGTPAQGFVSCAQPGLVQVFDPVSRAAVTNLVIDGNRPKAMAVSPDGTKVYVAIFESGNRSTLIGSGVGMGFPIPSPVDFPEGPHGGKNPPPNDDGVFTPVLNPALPAANAPPRGGLIVKKDNASRWMDDNHGDWTDYVSGANAAFTGRPVGWDLPDHDVAVINTSTHRITYASGLMNICMDVAVNPASGVVTVIGTDALNQIRFEPVLRGIFLRTEFASVDPTTLAGRVGDLNPHLDYRTPTVPQAGREQSIGDPRGIVWSADGTRGYVTGMGSDNLVVIDANGQRAGPDALIVLGQGPTGMALDEPRHRLYVLNRFSATLSVVDTGTRAVVRTIPLFDPTPTSIRLGRPSLYDTHKTSGLGQASCGSCHVDARLDRLAWDLGDPGGAMKFITNGNFGRLPPAVTNHFHPMKGPMTTLTLQDIMGHEPFHWRGDREGLEQFDQTFTNLQGAVTGLTPAEMQSFKEFLGSIRFAPNPYRTLSNTLSVNIALPGEKALGRGRLRLGAPLPNGNAVNGQALFRLPLAQTGCSFCHTLPTGLGTDAHWTGSSWINLPPGPAGEHHAAFAATERTSILPFRIPSLRNLFDLSGLDFLSTSNRSGFGFFHDGSVDTLTRFVQDSFDVRDDQKTADLAAFLLSISGSDLAAGSATDGEHPPGVPGRDTHAAVGRQITIGSPLGVALIDSFIALTRPATSRVDLVVKGFQDGIPRGWFFDRTTGRFQSDRAGESLTPAGLRQLAAPGNELTYTVVPRDSGRRIGVDRDDDGHFDRDELDAGTDPANPLSVAMNRPSVAPGLVISRSRVVNIPDPRMPAPASSVTSATSATGATLSWKTTSGVAYRVQSATNLTDPAWTDVTGNRAATNGTLNLTDTATIPQRFYRLMLAP